MSPTWFEFGPTAALSGRHREGRLLALGCSASGAQLLPDVGVKLRYPAVAESSARDPNQTSRRFISSVHFTRVMSLGFQLLSIALSAGP